MRSRPQTFRLGLSQSEEGERWRWAGSGKNREEFRYGHAVISGWMGMGAKTTKAIKMCMHHIYRGSDVSCERRRYRRVSGVAFPSSNRL